MEPRTIEILYEEFVSGLPKDQRDLFKMYEMDFAGENYPLNGDVLSEMLNKIVTESVESNVKFLALSALYFVLYEIYGK